MAIKATFPLINPFKFVKFSLPNTDSYFKDSIPHFEKQVDYNNPWKQGDPARFQIGVNSVYFDISQMQIGLYECGTDALVDSFNADIAWIDGTMINVIVSLQLPEVTGGHYIMAKLVYWPTFGLSDVYYVSEAIMIKATWPDTMLLTYYDKGYNKGVRWFDYENTPIPFYFRCYGGARSDGFNPESDDTYFISQTHGGQQLLGTPFISQKFTFGNHKGIPNFTLDQLNRVLSCRNIVITETGNPLIDGKRWSKFEGSKLEHEYLQDYPMSLPTMVLIKAENSDINEYDDPIIPITGTGIVEVEEIEIGALDFDDGLIEINPTIPILNPLAAYFTHADGSTYQFLLTDTNMNGTNIVIKVGELVPDDYILTISKAN